MIKSKKQTTISVISIVCLCAVIYKPAYTEIIRPELPSNDDITKLMDLCTFSRTSEKKEIEANIISAIDFYKKSAAIEFKGSESFSNGIMSKIPPDQQLSPEMYREILSCMKHWWNERGAILYPWQSPNTAVTGIRGGVDGTPSNMGKNCSQPPAGYKFSPETFSVYTEVYGGQRTSNTKITKITEYEVCWQVQVDANPNTVAGITGWAVGRIVRE